MIEIKTEKGCTNIEMSGSTIEIGADTMCIIESLLKTAIDDKDGMLFSMVVAGALCAVNQLTGEQEKEKKS